MDEKLQHTAEDTASPPKMKGPLSGVVVLSLAEQYPGPYATLLLADMGADVILVERPGEGDPARRYPKFYESLNRNKRSIVLNLKEKDNVASFKELVKKADVLLEGYRPGVMKRLGLSYENLSAINPGLIYLSITSFGQEGPYRNRPAHDFSCQGLAGVLYRQVRTHQLERPHDVAMADLSAATLAALAVSSALFARTSTGVGTYVDISMTDSLISWMCTYLGSALNGGNPEEGRHIEPALASFICSDGKLLTLSTTHEDNFWQSVCRVLGVEEIAHLNHQERIADALQLRAKLAEALLKRPRDEWGRLFDQNDIPWSPVHDLQDVPNDPQIMLRDMFTCQNGRWYVNQPIKFHNYETCITRPCPKLGEHTQAVLKQFQA